MLTKPVTKITPIQLTAREVEHRLLWPSKHGSRRETRAVELVERKGVANAVPIGFPDLVIWGLGSKMMMTVMSTHASLRRVFHSLLRKDV